MAKITYITHDGKEHSLDADNGTTVMENAVRNSILGIEAECGGACACATCHIYIDKDWADVVGKPEAIEEDMLDFSYEMKPESRLSCQVTISDKLDGLVVYIPEKQA